ELYSSTFKARTFMLKMNPRVTAFVLLVCLSGILAAHVPHQAVQDSEIFNPMTDDAAADM
ncbi:hypothetical protein OS493_039404, partial [Desmophyllum pertusum]